MKLSEMMRGTVRSFAPASPPEPQSLMKAIKAIEKSFPDQEPERRDTDPETVLAAFARRIAARNWSDCTVQDVADAARHAFAEPWRAQPDFAPVRTFLMREAAVTPHKGLLKTILDAHVATYGQGAEHTRALAKVLTARRADLPVRSREFLTVLPETLDALKGANALGQRIGRAKEARAIFAELPFIPSGGLIDEASAAFVSKLVKRMNDVETARRVLDWFAPEDGKSRKVGARLALDALLAPWHRNEPPTAWKQMLLDRLVAAYGDPRLKDGGAWAAADMQARETFIRWQTGATLDAFLDVVSETVDPEDLHMWEDRRPFWLGLHREGKIEAAWVAFSPAAAKIARDRAASSGIDALKHFGRQIAGGSRKKTSLLILRINGITVVEGSHSYQVHVFPKDIRKIPEYFKNNYSIPELYKSRYDCDEIRNLLPEDPNYKRRHKGEQWKIFVREETGCLR